MNTTTVVVGLILAFIMLSVGYLGVLFMQHWFKTRYPDPVIPVTPAVHAEAVPAPESWWDALHLLRAQFDGLQSEVRGNLGDVENKLRLARAAEERARKMRNDRLYEDEDDGLPSDRLLAALPAAPATPAASRDGWEPEETAPVGQPVAGRGREVGAAVHALLNQRRGR